LAERVPARLTVAERRRFGYTLGTAFLVLGALLIWRGHPYGASAAAVIGALLAFGGLMCTERLGRVQHEWMLLALVISWVTTPIIMGIVYFVAFTPTGLLMRLFGRNPIERGHSQTSFWVARPPGSGRSDIERQF
jgi:hypothetical protein